ncbi:hypothetical protein OAG63_01670, partial [Methylacidiphilales bacterium]|nr:hypothetical protein [Candidatus Methylacidiphilales bacterium]
TVKDSLDLLYDVNIVGSAGASSLFTLTIANAFPTGESDLEFEKGAILSMSLASEANTPAASGAHDGTGTIYIKLPTGSLLNFNGTTGSIDIPDGMLAISALYGIGAPENGNPANLFSITAATFAARTTSLNDVSNRNGIFVTTDSNLTITGYSDINGLSVAAGDIYVDVEGSGNTLSYYQLNAGSSAMGTLGGNITLIADHLAKVSSFTVTRDVETEVPIEEQIVTIVPVFNEVIFDLALSFGPFGILTLLPFFVDYTVQVTDVVTGYQLENKPTTITLGGADDSIAGTGTLTILNATSGGDITVGDQSANPASGLYLTNDILSTITTGFAGIVIGRTPPAIGSGDPTTGTVTVNNVAFDQAAAITIQGTTLDVLGSVSNSYALITPGQTAGTSPLLSTPESLLDFNAQDGITFSPTSTYAAGTIQITSGNSLDLVGTFISEEVSPIPGEGPLLNGQILIDSTAGSVTLDTGVVIEALQGSSNISITGTSILLDPTATIEASQTITMIATSGSIGYSVTTPTPNSVTAAALILSAQTGINLTFDAATLLSASTSSDDIVLTNTYSGLLTVNSMTATAGNITLATPGEIDLVRPSANTSNPIIFAGESVSLTSTLGAIFGDTLYSSSTYDIEAAALTLSAKDEIDSKASSSFDSGTTHIFGLVTDVGSLSATSTGTGQITILNVGSVTLDTVQTQAGLIAIYGTADINVQGTVSSAAGANTADTILLDNEFLAAGDGTINLGTTSIQGNVDAGIAAVTLDADDTILGASGFNLVSGSSVLLTAHGQQTIASQATDTLINVNLATQSVDANTEEAGQIFLETSDTANSLLLHNVQTFNGDITVTGASPTPGSGVNLITYEVNAHASDITLNTTGTITDDTDPNVLPPGLNDITGVHLTTTSVGDTILQTQIGFLDSYVGGVGSLTVNQGDGFEVTSAVTNDGFITINAGQATALQDFADANLLVGIITAGDQSAINLNVVGGSIFDPNYGQSGDTSLITGGVLTLMTGFGTEGNTVTPVGLNTAITQLDATGSGAGAYITITQTGDILVDNIALSDGGNIMLTAESAGLSSPGTITVNNITTDTINSTVTLTSIASDIQMQTGGKITGWQLDATAHTGITVRTDIGYLNATIDPTGTGDIDVVQDGNLEIGRVETPLGNFNLTVLNGGVTAASVTSAIPTSDPTSIAVPFNVDAGIISIDTTAGTLTGVATLGQNLGVYADTVDVTSTSTAGTGIFIHNYKIHTGTDAFLVDSIHAFTGPVSVTSAGNLLARDIEIEADRAGNDITLVTTNNGNILINFVGTGLADAVPGVTPPNFGNFSAISAGLINAVDPATAL